MKILYSIIVMLLIHSLSQSCGPSKEKKDDYDEIKTENQDTVTIENEKYEFKVIVFDPKFSGWLAAYARPRGYYSESFLKERNRLYVMEWNMRVLRPEQYDSSLYGFSIDYDFREDYGYEVNYLLYNYFVFFQQTYNQRLSSFTPRP